MCWKHSKGARTFFAQNAPTQTKGKCTTTCWHSSDLMWETRLCTIAWCKHLRRTSDPKTSLNHKFWAGSCTVRSIPLMALLAWAATLCVVGQTAAFLDTQQLRIPDIYNSTPLLWKSHKIYPLWISNYFTEFTIKACITAVLQYLKRTFKLRTVLTIKHHTQRLHRKKI